MVKCHEPLSLHVTQGSIAASETCQCILLVLLRGAAAVLLGGWIENEECQNLFYQSVCPMKQPMMCRYRALSSVSDHHDKPSCSAALRRGTSLPGVLCSASPVLALDQLASTLFGKRCNKYKYSLSSQVFAFLYM